MNWTREMPTEPGFYFWRQTFQLDDNDWTVRHVCKWPGGGLATNDYRLAEHTDGWTTPERIGGQWQGPIKPQEDTP